MFNSKLTGNRSPHPIDQQRDPQLIQNSRSSKSPSSPSFTSPRFVSPTAASSSGTGVIGSSPISVLGKFHHHFLHNQNSTLTSSRGCSSPLTSIENLKTPPSRSPPGFNTPVKVEEDVIVMDEFLVSSSPSGGRSKSSLDSPGSTGGLKQSSLFKMEMCRAWENKNCPNGRRCQFAHGKEEVGPTRFPTKNKSPSEVCKTFSTMGSCQYGAKCGFVHHGAAVMQEARPSSTITSEREKKSTLVSSPQARLDRHIIKEPAYRPITEQYWSPLDDNIPITKRTIKGGEKKCEKADRELVDAHINDVLYGPDRRISRLPVLSHICPADQ